MRRCPQDRVASAEILRLVLRKMAKFQAGVARARGVIAIQLPHTPLDGAYTLAERIREMARFIEVSRIDHQQKVGGITIAIGISARSPRDPIPSFIGRADHALHASKAAGRNRATIS